MPDIFQMNRPILSRQNAQCDLTVHNFYQPKKEAIKHEDSIGDKFQPPKQYFDTTMHFLKQSFHMVFKDVVTLKMGKYSCQLSQITDEDYSELSRQCKWFAPNYDLLSKSIYVNEKFAVLHDENNNRLQDIDTIEEFEWFIEVEIQGMKHGKDNVFSPILVLRRATRLAPNL